MTIEEIDDRLRYDAVTDIWLTHYHKLTGESGAPSYDKHNSLFWWIVKHEPNHQSHILQMCYQAGFDAGKDGKHYGE